MGFGFGHRMRKVLQSVSHEPGGCRGPLGDLRWGCVRLDRSVAGRRVWGTTPFSHAPRTSPFRPFLLTAQRSLRVSLQTREKKGTPSSSDTSAGAGGSGLFRELQRTQGLLAGIAQAMQRQKMIVAAVVGSTVLVVASVVLCWDWLKRSLGKGGAELVSEGIQSEALQGSGGGSAEFGGVDPQIRDRHVSGRNLTSSETIQQQVAHLLVQAINIDYCKDGAAYWLGDLFARPDVAAALQNALQKAVLEDETMQKAATDTGQVLVGELLKDPRVLEAGQRFVSEVLADPSVQQEASTAVWQIVRKSVGIGGGAPAPPAAPRAPPRSPSPGVSSKETQEKKKDGGKKEVVAAGEKEKEKGSVEETSEKKEQLPGDKEKERLLGDSVQPSSSPSDTVSPGSLQPSEGATETEEKNEDPVSGAVSSTEGKGENGGSGKEEEKKDAKVPDSGATVSDEETAALPSEEEQSLVVTAPKQTQDEGEREGGERVEVLGAFFEAALAELEEQAAKNAAEGGKGQPEAAVEAKGVDKEKLERIKKALAILKGTEVQVEGVGGAEKEERALKEVKSEESTQTSEWKKRVESFRSTVRDFFDNLKSNFSSQNQTRGQLSKSPSESHPQLETPSPPVPGTGTEQEERSSSSVLSPSDKKDKPKPAENIFSPVGIGLLSVAELIHDAILPPLLSQTHSQKKLTPVSPPPSIVSLPPINSLLFFLTEALNQIHSFILPPLLSERTTKKGPDPPGGSPSPSPSPPTAPYRQPPSPPSKPKGTKEDKEKPLEVFSLLSEPYELYDQARGSPVESSERGLGTKEGQQRREEEKAQPTQPQAVPSLSLSSRNVPKTPTGDLTSERSPEGQKQTAKERDSSAPSTTARIRDPSSLLPLNYDPFPVKFPDSAPSPTDVVPDSNDTPATSSVAPPAPLPSPSPTSSEKGSDPEKMQQPDSNKACDAGGTDGGTGSSSPSNEPPPPCSECVCPPQSRPPADATARPDKGREEPLEVFSLLSEPYELYDAAHGSAVGGEVKEKHDRSGKEGGEGEKGKEAPVTVEEEEDKTAASKEGSVKQKEDALSVFSLLSAPYELYDAAHGSAVSPPTDQQTKEKDAKKEKQPEKPLEVFSLLSEPYELYEAAHGGKDVQSQPGPQSEKGAEKKTENDPADDIHQQQKEEKPLSVNEVPESAPASAPPATDVPSDVAEGESSAGSASALSISAPAKAGGRNGREREGERGEERPVEVPPSVSGVLDDAAREQQRREIAELLAAADANKREQGESSSGDSEKSQSDPDESRGRTG
uniref:Uncharacterized protein n=1 Tax=Chromera velia CCMP2878 TaxID=1169474 RepID=A0A0G4HL76_9ALVE|eukprot:Cvel_7320.t1-p1 / transcript=Cvel_7320.t1 / gene=Cvel_7320 / organism=Chromera_velia_CCMP2878 / gene_product=hypothetical protein / transcript_product=hypothetical protein / location=Cvel_scaffold379:62178-69741(-) / protein_length=1282 / sequence_SO=supercontig / SO=protein_coding / is_pseudo=false